MSEISRIYNFCFPVAGDQVLRPGARYVAVGERGQDPRGREGSGALRRTEGQGHPRPGGLQVPTTPSSITDP